VPLPHRFPFRLVDRRVGESAVVAWTAGAYWWTDAGPPVGWLAEAMAQAAALLLAEPSVQETRLALAGLDGVECNRLPVAGEILLIEVKLAARLGPVIKVSAVVRADGEPIATGALLLAAP
jgi:3-hydroxymyristoyl/3-hydroxydecanoyl-(acyl carrier protein) dehydratase